jgi:hypothetical protein
MSKKKLKNCQDKSNLLDLVTKIVNSVPIIYNSNQRLKIKFYMFSKCFVALIIVIFLK